MKQEEVVVGGCPIYLSTLTGVSLHGLPSVPGLSWYEDSACIYFALYELKRKKRKKESQHEVTRVPYRTAARVP